MPRIPLDFGSPLNNDGEKLKSAFSKIDLMTAEIYALLDLSQPRTPFLTDLHAITESGLIARTAAGGAAVHPLGAFGQVLLGAGTPGAARQALQLGAAALLGTTGPGSVILRDGSGQIPHADLPPPAWADVQGKPLNFPPSAHGHGWGEIANVPALLGALAGLGGEGLVRRVPGGLDVATATPFGLSVLAAADAAAGRGLLQLGAAAMLPAQGAGGVVTRGPDGKILAGDLPAFTLFDVKEVDSEGAMLALDADAFDFCVRLDEGQTYYLAVEPASNLANWKILPSPTVGRITSVFGQVAPAVTVTGLAALAGGVADGDLLPLFDLSASGHVRVTRGQLLSMAGAPDGKPGLADGSASLLVATSAGAPAKVALADWVGAHPVNAAPAAANFVLTAPVAGLPTRTSLGDLFTGRTLTNSRFVGVTEGKLPRQDISGAAVMPPFAGANTYHYRLTGNASLTLPARPAAADTAVGLTIIVEQDATGGRALTLTPPGAETLQWSGGGAAPALNAAAGGVTVFSVMAWQGGSVWLAGKWF